MAVACSLSPATVSEYRDRGASTRDAAKQVCPELAKARRPSATGVAAGSASSSTIAAAFPPSSRLTDLNVSPQATAIRRPTDAGPAKETLSTPG